MEIAAHTPAVEPSAPESEVDRYDSDNNTDWDSVDGNDAFCTEYKGWRNRVDSDSSDNETDWDSIDGDFPTCPDCKDPTSDIEAQVLQRVIGVSVICSASLVGGVWTLVQLWVHPTEPFISNLRDSHTPWLQWSVLTCGLIQMILACMAALCTWRLHIQSTHVHQLFGFVITLWLICFVWSVTICLIWCRKIDRFVACWIIWLVSIGNAVCHIWPWFLIQRRVGILEQALHFHVRERVSNAFCWVISLLTVSVYIPDFINMDTQETLLAVYALVTSLLLILWYMLLSWVNLTPYFILRAHAPGLEPSAGGLMMHRVSSGERHELEIRWALSFLWKQQLFLIVNGIADIELYFCLWRYMDISPAIHSPWIRQRSFELQESKLSSVDGFALQLSWGLNMVFRAGGFLIANRLVGLRAYSVEKDAPPPPLQQPRQVQVQLPEWQEKVADLSERCVSLSSLLSFFSQLGNDVMPHFDPLRSTTNDVVRQAIIPCSRNSDGGGSALSAILEDVPDLRPGRMVTHTWAGLFAHLIAAVVADGFEMNRYDNVLQKLCTPGGIRSLRRGLRRRGTLMNSYWICAFCVNQHTSICGSLPGAPPMGTKAREVWEGSCRDTVTGEVHSICTCSQPKHFNDSRIECELNKFDDVMTYIVKQTPNMVQVIATDSNFDIFSRAWCVAELVEAEKCGIRQRLCIYSPRTIDRHYKKLKRLTVLECQASREEDKQEILAKIGDVAAFDACLRCLIMGQDGLLQQWMDVFGQTETLAHIVSRVCGNQELQEDEEFT